MSISFPKLIPCPTLPLPLPSLIRAIPSPPSPLVDFGGYLQLTTSQGSLGPTDWHASDEILIHDGETLENDTMMYIDSGLAAELDEMRQLEAALEAGQASSSLCGALGK